MKQTVRFFTLFLVSMIVGMILMWLCLILFTDMTWIGFREKLLRLDYPKLAGLIFLLLFSTIAGIFLQIILHEAGHLIFGLLSGFRFVSFRIGNFTLLRENGKYRIKRFAIAGTGGQCLMLPPDKDLSVPFAWYNAGGVLLNLLSASVSLVLVMSSVVNLPLVLNAFFIMFSCIGFLFAVMNGIPMKPGGFPNDGYNMWMAFADKEQIKYLAFQLRINAFSQEGVRLKDMPAEWFTVQEATDYSHLLQVNTLAMCGSRFADMGNYGQAQTIYAGIMLHKDKLAKLYIKEYTCELLFLELVGECRPEEVDKLYTNEIKTYVDQHKKHMPGKQLLVWAYTLFRENNPKKAKAIYDDVVRNKDRYLMQGEVLSTIALMDEMFARASQ